MSPNWSKLVQIGPNWSTVVQIGFKKIYKKKAMVLSYGLVFQVNYCHNEAILDKPLLIRWSCHSYLSGVKIDKLKCSAITVSHLKYLAFTLKGCMSHHRHFFPNNFLPRSRHHERPKMPYGFLKITRLKHLWYIMKPAVGNSLYFWHYQVIIKTSLDNIDV